MTATRSMGIPSSGPSTRASRRPAGPSIKVDSSSRVKGVSSPSVAAVVGELQVDVEVLFFDHRHDALQIVAFFSADTHLIALD